MFSGEGIPNVNSSHQVIQITIASTVDQQQRKPLANEGSNYHDAHCNPNRSEILINIINAARKRRNQLLVTQTN